MGLILKVKMEHRFYLRGSMKIKITEISHYTLRVFGDREILLRLVMYFTSHRIEKYMKMDQKLGRKRIFEEEIPVQFAVYREEESSILIMKGFFFYLITHLHYLKQTFYEELEYSTEVDIRCEYDLLDKWKTILRNDQLDVMEKLFKYNCGCIQLPTGFGKGEMIISIVDSYLSHYPEANVLICVPRVSVRDELQLRLKKYTLDTDPRIKVIIPHGFVKSKFFKDPTEDQKDWLNQVELEITDECHHLSAESNKKLLEKMSRLRCSYGFSATVSNVDLSKFTNFQSWKYSDKTIIGYTGQGIVMKMAKDYNKKIKNYTIKMDFGLDKEYISDYNLQVINQCQNLNYLEYIKKLIQYFPDYSFFIPVPLINAGRRIHDFLIASDIKTIHWTGTEGILPKHLKNLSDIKREMKNFRVLIATTNAVEGVDIPELDAAVLSFGRDWKFAPQAAGRAGRTVGSVPLIFNVCNEVNPVLRAQFFQRKFHIYKNYGIQSKLFKFEESVSE